MIEAHKSLDRIKILFKRQEVMAGSKAKAKKDEDSFVEEHQCRFLEAMDDDFNTPAALGVLFDLVSETNKFVGQNSDNFEVMGQAVKTIEEFTRAIFGFSLTGDPQVLNVKEQKLLNERQEARKSKDFKKSDELRDLLKNHDIIVEDTKDGQVWRRV